MRGSTICVREPRRLVVLTAAIVAMLWGAGVGAAPAGAGRGTAGELGRRLEASGRAEAQFERVAPNPIGGGERRVNGRLALEIPGRVGIEFPSTGERLTLRRDGGEWLQPELRQMIRLGEAQAAGARRWWALLAGADTLDLRPAGRRRFEIRAPGTNGGAEAPTDTAWITLAVDGLPAKLEIAGLAGAREEYRFRGWRFGRPRGREAFVIAPPDDYEVVAIP